jgi:hypothetical protein
VGDVRFVTEKFTGPCQRLWAVPRRRPMTLTILDPRTGKQVTITISGK